MDRRIDLNADVGEIPAALVDGSEERLIALLTSANVACGGHAGDAASMDAIVELAHRHGVAVGAHPGYPDRDGFGRRDLALTPGEIAATVEFQVQAFAAVAARRGVPFRHVKPHGALYNAAARNPEIAVAIARGVFRWRDSIVLVGLAGSTMLAAWKALGFRVAAEAFADRRYDPDGNLRARSHADALITDPAAAGRQAADIVVRGLVTAAGGSVLPLTAATLCVHGDTLGAESILAAVRAELTHHRVRIIPLG